MEKISCPVTRLEKRSSLFGKGVPVVRFPKIKSTALDKNICETLESADGTDLADY
jgi:hypothetical protein